MSYQRRRRGQPATVYKMKESMDSRGQKHIEVDLEQGIPVTAAFIPQRSARAEVVGQQQINVVRMIVDADLPDVGLWSRVHWRDAWWDVVTPPAYRHGTGRHVRHWSIDLRERP